MENSELNERSAEEVLSQSDASNETIESELQEESVLEEEEEEESQLSLKPETHADEPDELEKPVFPEETPRTNSKIIFNVIDAQYPVVKHVGKKIFKWKLSTNPSHEWDICWIDKSVPIETLAKMQPFQKINHFPGIQSIARKNNLGRNLMKMYKMYPKAYNFFPITYLLPLDYHDFKSQFSKTKKNKTFIVKPEASSQGKGIFLTRTLDNINPKEKFVAQKYIKSPYLIDGLKFDLRIYVLLAGCDPLRCYIYEDGLGRFATEPYCKPTNENLASTCMHLTNYAINKENPNFVFNNNSEADDVGHKKSLKAVFKLLEAEGHDTKALWEEIKRIILKTFCSVQPLLAHYYRSCHANEPYNNMCFEILGFDVMLDKRLKPWLIEVNHLPSFTTDTPLDESIKKNVIYDALKIMNISAQNKVDYKNKKKEEFNHKAMSRKSKLNLEEKRIAIEKAQKERDRWESKNQGGYQKIFPLDEDAETDEDYLEFMRAAGQHWQTWIGADVKKAANPNATPESQVNDSEAQPNKRATASPQRRKQQCVSPKNSSNLQAKKTSSSKGTANEPNSKAAKNDKESHFGPWGEGKSTDDSETRFLGKKRTNAIEESSVEEERGNLGNYKNIAHLSKSAFSFPKLRDHSEDSSVAGSSLTQRDNIGSTNIISDGNSGNHSERVQSLQKGLTSKQQKLVNVYGSTPKKPASKIESQQSTKQLRPESSKKPAQLSNQKEKEDSKKPLLKRIVNPNRRSAGGMHGTEFKGLKEVQQSLRKGSSKRGIELETEDQQEVHTPLKSPYRVLSPKRDMSNQEKNLERARSQDRFNQIVSPVREIRKKHEREASKDKSNAGNDISASKAPAQKPKKKKDAKQKNNEENDKQPKRITLYLSKEALTNPAGMSSDQENKKVWPTNNLLKAEDTKPLTKIEQISCNLLSPQYYKVKLGRDSSPVKVYEMKPNYIPKNKPNIALFTKKNSFLPESETSQSKLSVLMKDLSVESTLSPKARKVQCNNFFK